MQRHLPIGMNKLIHAVKKNRPFISDANGHVADGLSHYGMILNHLPAMSPVKLVY